ncbi:PREDICTED: uncharacterized protein LOC105560264, partial [Vollenhovia emeryi]|uniref:uncharacterized protein LOC105560264 n=1 Tax=Vollenhovia emeryi TaxID=411798 RepID=UPI0005F3A19D
CDDIGDNVVSVDVATATTDTTTTTTATTTTTTTAVADCCCFNRLSRIDSYNHWYQRYECGFCYFCSYGLYCPLENPGDFCCACGPCEVPKNVEVDIDHSVSNVKESKLLS